MLAIKVGNLIDGTGTTPVRDGVILVDGETITQVGQAGAVAIPPDVEVIDASDRTVMPGMIDCHVHVRGPGGVADMINPAVSRLAQVTELIETTTLKSYVHANQALAAGFTAIADMSAPGNVAIALRDAINEGLVEGPRMRACGQGLCITGGHMDSARWCPEVSIAGRTGVADSPWAFRQATRQQIKMGADCIKINVCGADHPDRHTPETPFWQEMTFEEMQAVCDEAHKAHLKVVGHTFGGPGITDGILAGVDSVEHGHWLTDEQAGLMAEHGVFYVPTLTVVLVGIEMRAAHPEVTYHPRFQNPAYDIKHEIYASLERARRAGVKIAVGTDAGFRVLHGENARELEAFVEGGMTPMEAIVAATSVGAERLDMADLVGTIEAGKFADLVIVDGDPLQDVRILQDLARIKTVIKGGQVVARRE